MDVFRIDLSTAPLRIGVPVVTIGNFDGLHRGHRKILAQTVRGAERLSERSVVLTFDPHPVQVLHPESSFCRLKTHDERLADLAELGIDAVALVRFDRALARTEPEEFVERVLARALGASRVLVGRRFRFGRARRGDFPMLEALGKKLGFRAVAVAPLLLSGAPISSTRVRQALAAGDVRQAHRLLGRPLRLSGLVVQGAGRGRRLGYPTANLATGDQCLPAAGVYASRTLLDGQSYAGATFIGVPATFGEAAPVVETHLLDYARGDLYGRSLGIDLVAWIRDSTRFASPELLRLQIARDLSAVRRKLRR